MPDDDKKRKELERKTKDKKIANLERALREERMGLTAIATAFCLTHGNPERMMRKLEDMVRAAVDDPRQKPGVKRALINGQQVAERALAIYLGKPQPLFDEDDDRPDTGHVNPSDARALADPPEQQVGFNFDGGNGEGAAEAIAAHQEREALLSRVDDFIIRLVRENDPMTDVELHELYCVQEERPTPLSWQNFYDRRVDLTRRGRLVDTGDKKHAKGRARPTWDVIERSVLT